MTDLWGGFGGALAEYVDLIGYVLLLGFAWVAAASCVGGLVGEYIDTVDDLVDDEAYAELRDLSIVERGGLRHRV